MDNIVDTVNGQDLASRIADLERAVAALKYNQPPSDNITVGNVAGQHAFIGKVVSGPNTYEVFEFFDQTGTSVGYFYAYSYSGNPTLAFSDNLDATLGSSFSIANGQAEIVGKNGVVITSEGTGSDAPAYIGGSQGMLTELISNLSQAFAGSGSIVISNGSVILFTGTSGGTLTLPAANAIAGYPYSLKIIDSGGNSSVHAITVQRSGSDMINNGSGSLVTSFNINLNYAWVEVQSDGANTWH